MIGSPVIGSPAIGSPSDVLNSPQHKRIQGYGVDLEAKCTGK
jgi:hypothetical protein